MPDEQSQLNNLPPETAVQTQGLDDNTSAAELSFATMLSQQILTTNNQKPMEEPKEVTDDEYNKLKEEHESLKQEMDEIRSMLEEALSEDNDEDYGEQE